jgi:DNA-binding transcriptional MerR regulator
MKKSADALRTISEVAAELDVPKHVLRFWESKFSHINPMKRGGGRRYYRPSDIELLSGIQRLLYGEGYTIRGVQQILKREGVDYVKSIAKSDVVISPETKLAASATKTTSKKKTTKTSKLDKSIDTALLASLLGEIENCRRILQQD